MPFSSLLPMLEPVPGVHETPTHLVESSHVDSALRDQLERHPSGAAIRAAICAASGRESRNADAAGACTLQWPGRIKVKKAASRMRLAVRMTVSGKDLIEYIVYKQEVMARIYLFAQYLDRLRIPTEE